MWWAYLFGIGTLECVRRRGKEGRGLFFPSRVITHAGSLSLMGAPRNETMNIRNEMCGGGRDGCLGRHIKCVCYVVTDVRLSLFSLHHLPSSLKI